MLRRFVLSIALLCLALTIAAPRARAAEKKPVSNLRDVQGIVSDASGQPVPGAVVQLKNTKTLQIISFITKEGGNYYFNGLSPDIDFELTAKKSGKSSATRTLSSFDSRKQAVMNLKLDRDEKP